MLHPNESSWILDTKAMKMFTEGWQSSTLVISPQLLLQLPNETWLVACVILKGEAASDSKFCTTYIVEMPEKCDNCILNAPDTIDDFQEVCVNCDCYSSSDEVFEFYSKSFIYKVFNISSYNRFTHTDSRIQQSSVLLWSPTCLE